MADAAWALFGDDDHDAAASDKKALPPPRASAHPFFAATRDCWCPDSPSDETKSRPFSEEAARASLNLEGRVPALAASLRGRDMRDPADALQALLETQSAARAADVIAASVRALAAMSSGIRVDDIAASKLNAAILLARAVKADRALDAANEAMTRYSTIDDDDGASDVAAADRACSLAMAAAEAAVLLAECALLVDDSEPAFYPPSSKARDKADERIVRQNPGRRWIGLRVVAASLAAATAERLYLRAVENLRETNDGLNCAKRLKKPRVKETPIRLRSLSIEMDEDIRCVVDELRHASISEGATYWDDADNVNVASVSTASFYNAYVNRNRPVVITGMLKKDEWLALETFKDLNWLREAYGNTPVPVESRDANNGRSRYGEDGGDEANVESSTDATSYTTLKTFLESYFAETDLKTSPVRETSERLPSLERNTKTSNASSRETVAYVSQHSLLHQVPKLQDHFAVPEFCLGRLKAANAWLGTKNTTTHLHTDDAENLLCQVAGYKLVKLFPPSCGEFVYQEEVTKSRGNRSVNTFSPVDCENVNEEAFPLFKEARKSEIQTVLGPGETLFIPRGWWHYVRALEPSFSVNFWF